MWALKREGGRSHGIHRLCGCKSSLKSWYFKRRLREKVSCNKGFQEACMYRFGKGAKRHIKIDKGIDYIESQLMIKESDL